MGTKRRKNSKRRKEGGGNSGRRRTTKDVPGLNVIAVIERERRNLRRASAVLASLSVSLEYLKDQIDAGDIADVARQLIDGAVDALDRVELERAANKKQKQQPP